MAYQEPVHPKQDAHGDQTTEEPFNQVLDIEGRSDKGICRADQAHDVEFLAFCIKGEFDGIGTHKDRGCHNKQTDNEACQPKNGDELGKTTQPGLSALHLFNFRKRLDLVHQRVDSVPALPSLNKSDLKGGGQGVCSQTLQQR